MAKQPRVEPRRTTRERRGLRSNLGLEILNNITAKDGEKKLI